MPVVLVVEDEAQVLVMAESILQESGYQTVTASTPAEALALIEPVQGRDMLHLAAVGALLIVLVEPALIFINQEACRRISRLIVATCDIEHACTNSFLADFSGVSPDLLRAVAQFLYSCFGVFPCGYTHAGINSSDLRQFQWTKMQARRTLLFTVAAP